MATETEDRHAEHGIAEHEHGCGHQTGQHEDLVDYVHDGSGASGLRVQPD